MSVYSATCPCGASISLEANNPYTIDIPYNINSLIINFLDLHKCCCVFDYNVEIEEIENE